MFRNSFINTLGVGLSLLLITSCETTCKDTLFELEELSMVPRTIDGAGNSILFTNNMRASGNNTQFYKTTGTDNIERNRIWLNFSNTQGAFKQLLIGYIEGATNFWDHNYDAITADANPYLDFYSINP